MKKITLFIIIAIAITTTFAATKRLFWYGDSQYSQIWDAGTTLSWYDPLEQYIPDITSTIYTSGATAIFDETAAVGSDTLKLSGSVTVDSLIVNNTRTYVLRSTTGYKADSITGTGVFVKNGSGNFVMDCKNRIQGGTIINAGKVMQEKADTVNIFGNKLVLNGGTASININNNASPKLYPILKVPVEIHAGVTGKIELGRYSNFTSPITGAGDLEISTAGERVMLSASKNAGTKIDWTNFSGNVTINKLKLAGVTPGYYALLLGSNKTFDNSVMSMSTVDSLMWSKKLTLKSGVGLTGCSGTHCWAIGELQAENDSCFLGGYGAGASASPYVYYMIGSLNTDVVFPGTIIDAANKNQNNVGIIKVGTGKYTFTSTKSISPASIGVTVKEGTFLVNIPITTPATTTALGRVKSTAMSIKANAVGGGNGRLTGAVSVDSLGTLVVGCDGVGQLELADTLSGTIGCPLNVHHYGKVIFKVGSKTNHDFISTNKTAIFKGGTILVKPASELSLNDGDSITILTTKTRPAVADSFALATEGFPQNISFTAAKDTIAGSGYKITLVAHLNTGLKNITNLNNFSVYPNPSTGIINIDSKEADIRSIEILNVNGQTILTERIGSKNAKLNLEKLPAGIYYTKVHIGDNVSTEKLIIK